MTLLESLQPEDIERMNYNELIGLVRETNRPPGGRQSVVKVAAEAFLTVESKVLDVGTSTGFTAIELARSVGCTVVGVDVNSRSLEEARKRASELGVSNVTFLDGDAHSLHLDDNQFDLVFVGNLVSLVPDPAALLAGLTPLVRRNGYMALLPMYYRREPAPELVEAVSSAIGVDIEATYREKAVSRCLVAGFEVVVAEDRVFDDVASVRIEEFCREILGRPHLVGMQELTKRHLAEKYSRLMALFAHNLSHMGFTILVLRQGLGADDPELFSASPISAV